MDFKRNAIKYRRSLVTSALAAVAFSSALVADAPPSPGIQIVDLKQAATVRTNVIDRATGAWQAVLEFDVKITGGAVLSFTVAAPAGVKSTQEVQTIATGFTHIKIRLDGTAKLPAEVTLVGQNMDRPMRITVPAVTITISDPTVDRIVLGSLLGSAILVIAGAIAAKKSLWTDIGTQSWTFDSLATNTAVGAGVVALVVKILPGADVPYTQLSAILGFLGAIAPTAYNLTTRTVEGASKGKVLFFVISAIFTGSSVTGQLQVVFNALQNAEDKLPVTSLAILEGILALVAAGFAYHLVRATRDTIVAQSSGATATMLAPRHALPGGRFSAL